MDELNNRVIDVERRYRETHAGVMTALDSVSVRVERISDSSNSSNNILNQQNDKLSELSDQISRQDGLLNESKKKIEQLGESTKYYKYVSIIMIALNFIIIIVIGSNKK